MRVCSVDKCTRVHSAKGFCKTHYGRWKAHGDPSVLLIHKTPRGEPMRWLEKHLTFNGPNCLPWPFNRCSRSGTAQMSIKRKTINPARIICEKLYGPAPTPRHEAAHNCGNGHEGCVHPKHVRWATHIENEADKRIHGTAPIGESHGGAKITEADVRSIRLSKDSSSQVAKQFGISFSMVCRIRRRQAWRHVA